MVLKRIDPQRGTIVVPEDIRDGLEYGDVSRRPDGVIELRPQLPVDAADAWFWSERWQRMEREADEAIALGRVRTYNDIGGMFRDLERPR